MACEIAAQGAQVIAVDIQADVAKILREDETYSGVDPLGLADLSNPADCKRATDTVLREFGGCDILVNCAGVSMGPLTPKGMKEMPRFWESEPAEILKLMAINATAPQLTARYLAPPDARNFVITVRDRAVTVIEDRCWCERKPSCPTSQ